MSVIYLRSTDGSDSDDGSTWALAKATLAAALTAAGAGGTVYVSQSHAETQSTAMTLTSPGTVSSPVSVLCVNDGAQPPTSLATTATVSTTTTSGTFATSGYAYIYGVSFNIYGNISFASTSSFGWIIDTGALNPIRQASSYNIIVGYGGTSEADGLLYLKNSNISNYSSNTTSPILLKGAKFKWEGGSFVAGGATNLITATKGIPSDAIISGVDLSFFGTGKSLVLPVTGPGNVKIKNCKLGASVTILGGSIAGPGDLSVSIDNCDSANTNYRMEHYRYQGSIKTETSKIKSGGASDGTTSISWNMTSLAGSSFTSPLESPPIAIWNDTTGSSKTVTIEIAQDSAATALTDGEVWIEVEELGTSSYPLSLIQSDRKSDILATGVNQTSSSVTWNNMTSPTRQSLAVTFTPQNKGYFQARVMLAKASTTIYVDPVLTVS